MREFFGRLVEFVVDRGYGVGRGEVGVEEVVASCADEFKEIFCPGGIFLADVFSASRGLMVCW